MKTYNKIEKNIVDTLNQKQSVLIETITEGEKKTSKIYLANCKKRSNVFYDIYKDQDMKPCRKKKEAVQKEYRILKLNKVAEMLKDVTCEYYQVEGYTEEVPAQEVEEVEVVEE